MKTQNKFEKFHLTTQNAAEDFLTDQMLYFVIVKNLEIIGEAASMLTKEFIESHTETDWKEIPLSFQEKFVILHSDFHAVGAWLRGAYSLIRREIYNTF